MPYTTRADGDVLTASSHNANCRDQVVSTVTSATRPAGTEGQLIAETDTDLFQAYTGSGWVPFGGWGAWTAYTPTFTQSVTVTKTTSYARYIKIGRYVCVEVSLTVTGAGTANNAIVVSAPITAVGSSLWTGTGIVYDSSVTTVYPMLSVLVTTTTFQFSPAEGNHGVNIYEGQTGGGFAAALASGDIVTFFGMYESAA